MMYRGSIALLLVAVLLACGILPACGGAAPAEEEVEVVVEEERGEEVFEFPNPAISNQEVNVGQSTTVSIDVSNSGEVEGACPVILKIDGTQIDDTSVILAPGVTQGVSFSVVKEEGGIYTVDVNGLTATFKVLKPAEFEMANLVIEPEEVTAGGSSEISAEVTNIGEEAGDYEVVLKVDGQIVETKKLSVDGGETETVRCDLAEEPGTHAVDVNGLTTTLVVKEPPKAARFLVSGLTVSPDWVATGGASQYQ